MSVQSIRDLLAKHPIFRDFDDASLDLAAGCGVNRQFAAGEMLFREGDLADKVLIMRRGDVAIEVSAPHKDAMVVETRHPGDIVDWSWMVPPYRTMSDARAMTDVGVISLDSACILGKCDEHPTLGYHMFKTWLPHLARRVRAQRLQLLDLYGTDAR